MRVGFLKYLKAAFINRWNLLALLGAGGAALLSGRADVFLPLVLAGEAAYIGLLGMHPRFQKYVDAHQNWVAAGQSNAARERMLQHILRALPRDLLNRFEALRRRCVELRNISSRERKMLSQR